MALTERDCLDACFLNIVKPRRMTSAKLVAIIKRAGNFRRVGHAGTLDPLADGVLPVAIGKATRMITFLQSYTKSYVAVVMFGISTTTDDLEGAVVDVSPQLPSPARIRTELQRMVGLKMQKPPLYSALRTRGERAYAMLRSGRTPQIKERRVSIASARLLSVNFWNWRDLKSAGLGWTLGSSKASGRGRLVAAVEIECGSGTYIRSIARDLGIVLGTQACVAGLTRTRVGPFHLLDAASPAEAVRLIQSDSVQRVVYPADTAGIRFNGLVLGSVSALRFVQGLAVDVHGSSGMKRVYDCGGEFVGMGEVDEDRRLRPKVVLRRYHKEFVS